MSGLKSDQSATRVVKPATVEEAGESGAIADTYGGRMHVEWDPTAAVTPLGVPGGCRRYAHLTALRCDAVNPPVLGMTKMVSENVVRRGLGSIAAASGEKWMGEHLLHCVRPLLGEPWVLDVDTTVKPLYGHQEGAEVGYNPGKRGRPSHSLHTYLMANVRLVLEVEVRGGKQNGSRHSQEALWRLLDRLGRSSWPSLLRGDSSWGSEPVMQRCEQEGLAYLLRLRQTAWPTTGCRAGWNAMR